LDAVNSSGDHCVKTFSKRNCTVTIEDRTLSFNGLYRRKTEHFHLICDINVKGKIITYYMKQKTITYYVARL